MGISHNKNEKKNRVSQNKKHWEKRSTDHVLQPCNEISDINEVLFKQNPLQKLSANGYTLRSSAAVVYCV